MNFSTRRYASILATSPKQLDGTQTGVQSPRQDRLDHIFLTLPTQLWTLSPNLLFFEFFLGGGGGYFANLTLNTKSKSAIFEFFWGEGYFANLTLNTKFKSAMFEFFLGGGGYFANPTWATLYLMSLTIFISGGGGGGGGVLGLLWSQLQSRGKMEILSKNLYHWKNLMYHR